MVEHHQVSTDSSPSFLTQPRRSRFLRRRMSRRTIIVGLAGVTALIAVGGGTAWWTLSPHPLYIYRGHSDFVNAVAWSPNGTRIASGSNDGTVQVWDASDGGHAYRYHGHTRKVTSVAWSPDGKRIASGSDDGTVQVWDASDGGHVYRYHGHTAEVVAVAWSPDAPRSPLALWMLPSRPEVPSMGTVSPSYVR